jgi:hypothetical protein
VKAGVISFQAGILFSSFFDSEDGDVPPKRLLTSNGLHDVISQKIVFLNFHPFPIFTKCLPNIHLTNIGVLFLTIGLALSV